MYILDMQIYKLFSLIKFILFFGFYKIISSNLYIKIEWREHEKSLPRDLFNKLDKMDKHRFELKLHVRKNSADTDFSGYILHSKITEKYDYCKFDKHELSTGDKTPIAFQKNIYTLEVLFNKQVKSYHFNCSFLTN